MLSNYLRPFQKIATIDNVKNTETVNDLDLDPYPIGQSQLNKYYDNNQ